jgi:hypothetical protein
MLFETFGYPQEESLESTQSLNGTLGAVAAVTFQYEFTLLASIPVFLSSTSLRATPIISYRR